MLSSLIRDARERIEARWSADARSATPPIDLLLLLEEESMVTSLTAWIVAGVDPLARVADAFLLERCLHQVAGELQTPLPDDEATRLHLELRAAVASALQILDERDRREVRGPVTVALAAVSLLAEQVQSEELRHLAARALSSLQRIEARLGERLSRGPMRCELAPLLRGLVEEMVIVHGPRFVLRAEPVEALVDAPELRCALHELLEHAARRSEVVELSLSSHSGEVWLRMRSEPEALETTELLRQCADHHQGRVEGEAGSLTLVLPGTALAIEA
jgi:hypothetical protein